jgi:hypothetical protein
VKLGCQKVKSDGITPQEPRGTSLPAIIAFQVATPAHALRPLELVMMQQCFTGMHDQGHFEEEGYTETALSQDM